MLTVDVLKNGVGRYNIFFFNFYTKLAKCSFLCRFRVESVNVFVLPRFDLSTCSSINKHFNKFAHGMHKRFPEWVHRQVLWILRVSTLKFYWIQENQTAMYFLRSRLFMYDIMKNLNCNQYKTSNIGNF